MRIETENRGMPVKSIAAAIAATLFLLVASVASCGLVGHNDSQDWQIYQSPFGTVTVIDKAGYYPKIFGSVWTYPRAVETYYAQASATDPTDDSILATFNDGGTAKISTYVRFLLPVDGEKRLLIH